MGETVGTSRSGGLRIVQAEHRYWIAHNFPAQTPWQVFMGMAEELGELSHALLKRDQQIRGNDTDFDDGIKDACADLVIFMCGLADLEGFDLMDVINETWTKVKKRDWISFPVNGLTE